MQLSEYYMAVKTIHENSSIQIVILDRTLAGDLAHLIWSVAKTMEEDGSCILQGKDTKYGKVTGLDLSLRGCFMQMKTLKYHLLGAN